MTASYPILGWLADQAGPAADDALLAALDLSAAEDQGPLAEALIARGRPGGLAGLIARLHQLPAPVQANLRQRVTELAPGLRPCIVARQRQTRVNAMDLIADGRHAALAQLAVLSLADDDRQIANRGGDALRNFVRQFLAAERPMDPAAGDDPAARERFAAWDDARQQLRHALRNALANYESHQKDAVLETAVVLADELEDILRPMLERPHSRTGEAVQEMALHGVYLGGAVVPFMYLALSVPNSRNRFAGRIGMLRDRRLLTQLIGQVDRADDTDVARGLAAVKRMVAFETPGWWEQMPDELSDRLARWICAIGGDPALKVRWLLELAAEGSPQQQAAAVDQFCRWQCDDSTEALKRLAGHRDGELANRVAGELARRGCIGHDRLRRAQLAHPDEQVRRLARGQLADLSFDKFWGQYPRLATEVREFAAAKLRRVVGDLPRRLAARMTDPDAGQRLQAVLIAGLCGVADQIKDALFAACADSNAKVRSAVIKLLGQVAGPMSERLARAALADSDHRVRANAVEALEALRMGSAAAHLLDMLDDPDNRIRANVIKAVMAMNAAAARDSLARMLNDGSANHRLSALWVVEQAGWLKPAERVLQLAQGDPDKRVRRRALRTLSELRRVYRGGRAGERRGKVPLADEAGVQARNSGPLQFREGPADGELRVADSEGEAAT